MGLFKRPVTLTNKGEEPIELDPGESVEVDFVLIGDEARVLRMDELDEV